MADGEEAPSGVDPYHCPACMIVRVKSSKSSGTYIVQPCLVKCLFCFLYFHREHHDLEVLKLFLFLFLFLFVLKSKYNSKYEITQFKQVVNTCEFESP